MFCLTTRKRNGGLLKVSSNKFGTVVEVFQLQVKKEWFQTRLSKLCGDNVLAAISATQHSSQ